MRNSRSTDFFSLACVCVLFFYIYFHIFAVVDVVVAAAAAILLLRVNISDQITAAASFLPDWLQLIGKRTFHYVCVLLSTCSARSRSRRQAVGEQEHGIREHTQFKCTQCTFRRGNCCDSPIAIRSAAWVCVCVCMCFKCDRTIFTFIFFMRYLNVQ